MTLYSNKLKYGFILVFFLCTLSTTAQIANNLDKRLIYQLKYQPDSTDSNRIESEYFFLDFSAKESVFRSETTHLKDSINNSKNPMSLLGLRQQIPKTRFNYRIGKKIEKQEATTYYDYLAHQFILADEPLTLNWKINSTSKDILGHSCIEATVAFRGRNYVAYFTESIPFSDGPYKFKGLPGMILELYDTKKHYHFETVSIEKLPIPYDYHLASHKKYKKISNKELREFQDKIKENPALMLANPNIQLPPEAYEITNRRGRERNKTRNNPIELSHE
ncbi:GLPGLI family protein [Flavobacterium sp. NKUCC04_CG]|uniref:GLPGLI family protein n=1 Tax=Flavobacterium sp. NKUCC04_CG TaxID=2842121 RepID=UPI001C5B06C2|nr:GLPGLI family protein [Flavobacterium sp. NKUCC04_CG]MBW3518043.1 GLPGLI family protein [Flavobacterium sp. NKUCC04_CG]